MRALPVDGRTLLLSACTYGPTCSHGFRSGSQFPALSNLQLGRDRRSAGHESPHVRAGQGSIDRALAARGYTPASPGDFAISFTVGERDRFRVYDYGPSTLAGAAAAGVPAGRWGGGGWGWGGWGGWGPPTRHRRRPVYRAQRRDRRLRRRDAASRLAWRGDATANIPTTSTMRSSTRRSSPRWPSSRRSRRRRTR